MSKDGVDVDRPTSKHTGVTWNNKSRQWQGIVYNPSTKKFKNSKPSCFAPDNYDACVAAVAALRARIDAECAAAGVVRGKATSGPQATVRAAKQSNVLGVRWLKSRRKWIAVASNHYGGKKCIGHFDDVATAKKALDAVRAKLLAKYDLDMATLAAADPLTKNLTRAPSDLLQAEKGVVYWNVTRKSEMRPAHTPYRVVRMGNTSYYPACETLGCATKVERSGKHGKDTHCLLHGGGCPHNKTWVLCRECNVNVTQVKRCCSVCGIGIDGKRKVAKGGNGLCTACETHQRAEAADAGAAPPPASKRWEDVVLDALIPQVKDKDTGVPFAFEMRDSMTHMLGSSSKRRRGECDTTKQRRPDLLYVVREPERGRIVAALKVGVDEHSHEGYEPTCESGKIDDQFQALQTLAAKEGAAAGAVGRHDAQMVFCLFVKFNPNACDVTPPVKLEDRVARVASRCSNFMNTPASEFSRMSEEGEANVPHVQCFYYHSKQGAGVLEHIKDHAADNWVWYGNDTGSS